MLVLSAEQAAELSPLFKGKLGRILYKLALRVTGIGYVNQIHDAVDKAGIAPGPDFAKGIIDQIGIDFLIGNPERLQFPEGPFIAIANHVYGHIDGICLVDVIGHVRPQVKVMVNQMLMYIRGLAPNFISVNPTVKSHDTTSTSINGVKNALLQLRNGEPLAIFPSGAVADLKPREGWTISERDWQDAAIRLIRKARVPIVPIRFFDRNSMFYYLLGLINYRIRFVRLFHEVHNKKGSVHRMGIGQVISVEEQDAVPEKEFKSFLRKSVYDMPMPDHFIKRSELWK